MNATRLIQVNTGLGAGNVGDELMAQCFWENLPEDISLDVALLSQSKRFRGKYPARHSYRIIDKQTPGDPLAAYPAVPNAPGLVAGSTLVFEDEGLHWPLGTLGPTLGAFHERGLPLDAVGVGVDQLHRPEARELFQKYFAPIRSWTVRTAKCEQALLQLGVAQKRIRITADLAWLHTPNGSATEWAFRQLQKSGISPGQRLLIADLVPHRGPNAVRNDQAYAEAFDRLKRDHGFQIAFLHNECRTAGIYDVVQSRRIAALMTEPTALLPTLYYSPGEVIEMLRHATAVISHRIHMVIEAVLAGTVPIGIHRGQKMLSLLGKLHGSPCGSVEAVDANEVVHHVLAAHSNWRSRTEELKSISASLRETASSALYFVEREHRKIVAPAPAPAAVSTTLQYPAGTPFPADVVLMHLGGLGDLVLFSGFIATLKRAHPETRVTLLMRDSFRSLVDLMPMAPDTVIGIDFDPARHIQPSAELDEHLQRLQTALRGLHPGLFVTCELKPSWLSWFVAAFFRAGLSVSGAGASSVLPRGVLPIVLSRQNLTPTLFEGPEPPAGATEAERYEALSGYLGLPAPSGEPWVLPAAEETKVRAKLRRMRIAAGEYILCFPFGSALSTAKRWPEESFVALLSGIWKRQRTPVVLAGDTTEHKELRGIASRLRAEGVRCSVFAGGPGDLGQLAAFVHLAKVWVGADTGTAHLGQAYRKPGVIAFGGGGWPNYRPWAPGTIAVVQPMPCFGCGWDCAFGHGLCVETIPVEAMSEQLQRAISHPPEEAAVHELHLIERPALVAFGEAAVQYRNSQEDRHQRFQSLVELEYRNDVLARSLVESEAERNSVARESELRSEALQHIARSAVEKDERLTEFETLVSKQVEGMEELDQVLRGVERRLGTNVSAASGVSQAIEQLLEEKQRIESASERRLKALNEADSRIRWIEEESDRRSRALEQMHGEVAQRDRRLQDSERAASERLSALQAANELLGQKTEHIAALEEGIEYLREVLMSTENRAEQLNTAAQERLGALEAATGRIAELETGNQERLDALGRAEARITELESSNRDRLVALEWTEDQRAEFEISSTERLQALQNATVRIEMLERACEERLVALEATEKMRLALEARLRQDAEEQQRWAAERDGVLRQVAEARELSQQQNTDLSSLALSREALQQQIEAERAQLHERVNTLNSKLQSAQSRTEKLTLELLHLRRINDTQLREAENWKRSSEEAKAAELTLRKELVAVREQSLLQSIIRRFKGTSL